MRLAVRRDELVTESFSKEVTINGGTRTCRCIVGHYLHAQGVADDELTTYGTVSDLINDEVRHLEDLANSDWLVIESDDDYEDHPHYHESDIFEEIVRLNDTRSLSRETKEERLRELFAEHDVQLEFIGEYDDAGRILW